MPKQTREAIRHAWIVPLLLALSPLFPARQALAQSLPGPTRIFLPILRPPERAIDPPIFSVERGFRAAPFPLRLSAPAGTSIRYTTDGSAPAPGKGEPYTGPIVISGSTVVRALAYRPGSRLPASPVATHSYLFLGQVPRQPEWPAGFPATWGRPPLLGELGPIIADYGMDPEIAADPRYRDAMRAGLESLPSLSIAASVEDLFGNAEGIYANATGRGVEWERPVSVEMIQPDGRSAFQADAGIRIAGVASRHHQFTLKHSLSLRFRSRYGGARLDYPLFPGSSVESFDTLRLRAGFNDSFLYLPWRAQYIRDAWGRASQRDMGWASAQGRFVHLYLDGLYWGVYELAEEPTAAWAADHLGGREADYDVVESNARGESGVEDGTRSAYERLIAIENLADPNRYRELRALLDLPQHIDYLLLNMYGVNLDWPHTNWRAARNRVTGGGFQFLVWDYETSLDLLAPGHANYDPTRAEDISRSAGVDGLHDRLMRNAEYRMAFADRVRKHLLGDGALTAGAASARYRRLAEDLDAAMVLESARWGDGPVGSLARRDGGSLWSEFWQRFGAGHPQSRDEEWRVERDRLLQDFFPRRDLALLWQLCDRVLYPPIAAPDLDPPGGVPQPALRLVMRPGQGGCPGARRDGQIYYSLDGIDPREADSGQPSQPWTGRISHKAIAYKGPIRLTGYSQVMARTAVLDGGQLRWSALTSATFGSPALAFTELMYHPPIAEAEFLEISNLERLAVDLSGFSTRGITFTFPAGTRLAANDRLVLVRDPEAFARQHPGVAIGGVYGGRLDDAGERLRLLGPGGEPVIDLTYDNDGFWPLSADGRGHSLVPWQAGAATGEPEAWRASALPDGSPGRPDPQPNWRPVRINEVLAHAAPPLEDAIELYNPGPELAQISGWFLGDDPDDPRAFRIPEGTLIGPEAYMVFYARDLKVGVPGRISLAGGPAIGKGLRLPARGGRVYLASADLGGKPTGYLRGFEFGAADVGVSFGRVPGAAAPETAALEATSLGADDADSLEAFRNGAGAPNAPPRVGPVVIDEIMYHPDPRGTEFVEVHNISTESVLLHEAGKPGSAWRFTEGIGYTFPAGASLPPGARALVVPIDPILFRAQVFVPQEVEIFGPYAGRLSNGGERLTLSRPFEAVEVEVDPAGEASADPTSVVVDRIDYRDSEPWPLAADGLGASLERRASDRYGNDPSNWLALATGGTPGRALTRTRQVFLPFVTVRR
jgi:hypothetical protein